MRWATLLFNVAHYALRPWPWILIALASIVVFPTLADLQAAFPNIPADKIGHDLAYPAMLSLLPEGLLGLVAASLLAAFMSTMSTQLNLGAATWSTTFGCASFDRMLPMRSRCVRADWRPWSP